AHHDGHCTADQAGDDREHEIHRADVLVVRRIHEPTPSRRMIVRVMRAVSRRRRSHDYILRRCRYRPLLPLRNQTHSDLGAAVAATVVRDGASSCANLFFASASQAANARSLTTRTAIGMKA